MKKKSSSSKSNVLKILGTSAAIVVVASGLGIPPGVMAGAIFGATLAVAFC
jgi:small-conductance mechanosensitive channel